MWAVVVERSGSRKRLAFAALPDTSPQVNVDQEKQDEKTLRVSFGKAKDPTIIEAHVVATDENDALESDVGTSLPDMTLWDRNAEEGGDMDIDYVV